MSPRKQITYSEHPNRAARSAHAKGEKAFRTYDTSYIRPKRSPLPAIIGVIVLIVALLAIVFGVFNFMRGCSSSHMLAEGRSAEITIEEGEGAKSVGQTLADAGLISNANEFTDRVAALNADGTLQPGTYTLVSGQSIDDMIKIMQTPATADKTFTIPEGSTIAQTADIVATASEGRISADDFKNAASNASTYAGSYSFLADVGENSLEGFLFPKTYPINDESTADSAIRAMLDQFASETAGLDYSYPESLGYSRYDVVKLASIIERETDDQFRDRVAGVFYNRMAIGMQLQSDATTAYYIGHEPSPEDLQDYNEYNTYLNYGLPPTPINSPSLGCLQAACQPEETSYLYFFIAPDESGTVQHSFSETYEEHQTTF